MATQREVADDMLERCGYVFEIEGREPDDANGPTETVDGNIFGATAIGLAGEFIAVEIGVGRDGNPFMSLRGFNADGSPGMPTILTIGDSLLVTA